MAPVTWGLPAATAERVAVLQGMVNRVAIFGYRRGTAMVSGQAPARRVGFFAANAAAANLTDNGVRLFAAAIDWAIEISAFTSSPHFPIKPARWPVAATRRGAHSGWIKGDGGGPSTERSMDAMVGRPVRDMAISSSILRMSTTRFTPGAPAAPRP